MSQRPLVSVVIPCYNCARFLAQTIQSVYDQTYPEIELVLVEDGSTDGTRALVERYEDKAVCHFGPNRGAAAARNKGTELASGRYIQYLDADDHLYPEAIEQRVEALKSTEAEVAYSAYRRLVPQGQKFLKGPVVTDRHEDVHPDPEIATVSSFWVPPVAVTYRRSIVETIGGWNESLPVIQDARFLHDAAFYGGQFVRVPDVLGAYRDHREGSLSSRDQWAFDRDILRNAEQIEQRWRERNDDLSSDKKEALVVPYDHCARSFFGEDQLLYASAARRVRSLAPHAASTRLRLYMMLEKILGYSVSVTLEQAYEATKGYMKSKVRPVYRAVVDLQDRARSLRSAS